MGHRSQERNLTSRTLRPARSTLSGFRSSSRLQLSGHERCLDEMIGRPAAVCAVGSHRDAAGQFGPRDQAANALEHGDSASCKLMMSSESTAHIGRFLRDFPGPGGPRGRTGLSAAKCAKGDPAMLAADAISDIWRGLQAGQRPYGISRSPFPPPPKACGRARALCSGRKEACVPAARRPRRWKPREAERSATAAGPPLSASARG